MKLDPQAQKLLDDVAATGLPPVYTLKVATARERLHNAFINNGIKEEIKEVKNVCIPCPQHKLGLRIYNPNPSKELACLLFFHGGGWTLNDLDTHDNLCRSISNRANIVIVSVDYRLAPEYKYPAGIEDAYTALVWTYFNSKKLNINKDKIAVGGDSSGATQAAVLCQLSRDRGGPKIIFQWLAYPVTDYYLPGTKSYIEFERGYSNNRDFMIWFWNNYLPVDYNISDPYLFPLRAEDFRGLPPAFIMTANFDPLRDEGEIYGDKLRASNVETKIKRYEGQMHGFLLQRHRIDKAEEALNDIIKELILL